MSNKTIIAVDAMGGENSPKKILEGIEISLKKIRAEVISQEKDTQLNAVQSVRILEFVRRHQKPIAPNIPPSGHGDSY